MSYRKILAGTALAAALGLGMPALAQTTDPMPEAVIVDSAQLDAFVLAYVEVTDLREHYIAQLQDAQSQEDQQAIMQEANAEITGAVDAVEGMDVATYETILAMAQDDPQLVNRINSRIETISNQ
ncbi:MAG: hypothetical protein COW55_03260 [Rhodobacteraceae bacterium CG17_big_fil_post_rev_8_21_14_2_50_65_11]|nr:MAG: hypothetical protein COW55_03260 [Rhodobacteraceae bacterium CG17_big_fil_post_rev_8_21_14_2_50_65_11]